MNKFIVIAVCNFDDAVVGVWNNIAAARRQAHKVLADPDLRFNSPQPCDTDFRGVRILAGKGSLITEEHYWEAS
jgi:hypothetical protein